MSLSMSQYAPGGQAARTFWDPKKEKYMVGA
jgi:hypothetical protein